MTSPVDARAGAPEPWRRRALIWLAAALVLALAAVGGVVVANATAFGAAGFVRIYLDALQRGDLTGALSLPGVDSRGLDPALLTPNAIAPLAVDEVREVAASAGIHRVEVRWRSGERGGVSVFELERTGTTAGLFARWAFATSPLAGLELSVQHDERAHANGVPVTTGGGTRSFAVAVPGVVELRHDSRWLTSATQSVVLAEPGSDVAASLEVLPRPQLTAAVVGAMTRHLEGCTAQSVLFPTGCPFGYAVSNRVASPPQWTIVDPPEPVVVAGSGEHPWQVPPATGTARIRLEVQSIFDGSVDEVERLVDFEVAYRLEFGPGDRVTVVPLDTLSS